MGLVAAANAAYDVALLTAIFLLTAVVGIRIARMVHIPRVVGYLVLGLGLQILVKHVLDDPPGLQAAVPIVNIIKTVALNLILFAIGASFDAAHLRAIRGHIWKITASEVLAVFGLVFLLTLVVGDQHSLKTSTFLAIVAIETGPAATLLVLRQYGAKGPMTDHMIAMIGMNALIAIVLFNVAFLTFAEIGPAAGGIHAEHMVFGPVVGILLATVGSAVIGFVLGILLSLGHVKLTKLESLLGLFAVLFASSVASKAFGLNHLMMCMFMGLSFTNFAIQPRKLLVDVDAIASPLYAIFFVLAGYKLELGYLPQAGIIGGAFLLARLVGKVGGSWFGVRWIGPRHRVPKYLGTAMLCQAGVAIGLGEYLVTHWGHETAGGFVPDPVAVAIDTVILASVAIFELTGALAVKWAMVRAGEVKAVTLLSRPGGSLKEMATIVSRLGRAFTGKTGKQVESEPEVVTARHAMRTNIDSLPDTAKMADVLRFVEHSRLNHFFVVDEEGHFVGTIEFPDLRNLMFNPIMAKMLTAYDMANTAPPYVLADQPLAEVLDMFHQYEAGSLPVLDNRESRRLLGVIEQRDVLKTLHIKATGEEDEGDH